MPLNPLQNNQKKVRNSPGVTVISLIVCIAIIMLIASVGIPSFIAYRRHTVALECTLLIQECLNHQQYAFLTNKPITITLDKHHQSYTSPLIKRTLPATVRFGIVPHTFGPPAAPTHILTNPISFSQNCITFWPSGHSDAGTVYMVDSSFNFLYAMSIGVSPIPYVRMYRYDGGWIQQS